MEFQARWPTPHSPMATKWHRGAKFNKEPNDFFFKFNNLRALNGCKGLPWRSSGLSLPYYAGDMGLIPGWETKIPHALEQLSLCCKEISQVTELRLEAAK